MSNSILDDSYWFINEKNPESPFMAALCKICHLKENKGWFWDGKNLGYGDYDLFCDSCGKTIYLREKNENKTTCKS
jgi:hypothetical protein